jgi:SRSO17 transposase
MANVFRQRLFQARKAKLMAECKLAPQVFAEVESRLEEFMRPFVEHFSRKEQVAHAHTFVNGLLSGLERRNVESIAYRYGQERMPLQWFIGQSPWSDDPLRAELTSQIARDLGDPNGVLVFDPSAFPKSGTESVGVQRQWCGRLGKIDNCQVAIYLGYVTCHEHTLVDTRLYLPKEWTTNKSRMKKAGVPKGTKFQTRHELALELLSVHGSKLPHAWITGDDEMGRPHWFRRALRELGEQYLLAVPCNTLIRDLACDIHHDMSSIVESNSSVNPRWLRVDSWLAEQPDSAWTKLDVRDGSKGPLMIEILKHRVAARTDNGQQATDEMLVVIRYKDRDDERVVKVDYYLSNAAAETELMEFASVAKAEHRVEECIQRCKSEAGLDDYEVRNWVGWQHHQTMCLIANWFLVSETLRGKKIHTGDHAATNSRRHCANPASRERMRHTTTHRTRTRNAFTTKRAGEALSLETP